MSSMNNNNPSRCPASNRGKRTDAPRGGRTPTMPRVRSARPQLGPNMPSAANYAFPSPLQSPQMANRFHPPRSTPLDPNMSWMQQIDSNAISNIIGMANQSKSKKAQNPNLNDSNDERFLIKKKSLEENAATNEIIKAKKRESLMQWFDRNVEMELKKRRDLAQTTGTSIVDPALKVQKKGLPVTDEFMNKMAESSASGIEFQTKMRLEPDTELASAVEKLAIAEAMISFVGCVKAAEAAVENAPPDKAEEAAAEGVKKYQTITNTVHEINQSFPGTRPVEVIGYIGVTKPKEI